MKISAKLSLFFISIAIFLELLTSRYNVGDIRLFVGVFIVLGMAFMIYTFNEYAEVDGWLLFKDNVISKETLISPHQEEYFLKQDIEYLWIEDSIFLDYKEDSSIYKFILGILSAIGSQKPKRNKQKYVNFVLNKDSYIDEMTLNTNLKSNLIKVLDDGDAHNYYSKVSIIGNQLTLMSGVLLVLALLVYIVLQIIY
ncbi:MAG: hypothetical protein GX038_06425 [Erysipelothrix sp.]|nr:hypothetical protein [Erysipelothrix sp.]